MNLKRVTPDPERGTCRKKAPEGGPDETEERSRRFLEATRVIPWEADATTWRFTYVGPQAVKLLGYPQEEWYGDNFWTAHLHPEDREYALDLCAESSRKFKEYDFEYRMIAADGQSVWLHDFVGVECVEGQPKTLRGYMIDITERKRAHEVSSEMLELAHLYERAPIGLCITDTQHRYVRTNKQLSEINGKSVEEHTGRTIREVIPHIADQVETMFQNVIDSAEPVRGHEVRGQTSAYPNEERIFLGDHYPLMSKDGRVLYVHTMVRDITAQRRAETALQESKEVLEARVKERTAELEELRQQIEEENQYFREEIKKDHDFEGIVGQSDALSAVLEAVEVVAPTEANVLILGETGTGKELIARAIHSRSSRKNEPLVKVDCASLPNTLVGSELFGHERGAFTGALSKRTGRFELADGGTIFLDEIGELELELQSKLLRVIENGEFERIGSNHTRKVSVRIIAATNRNLEQSVKQGTFRRDLYYRLKVFPLQLPPLRERKEDIPLLLTSFLAKYQGSLGKTIKRIPRSVTTALHAYDWPGNVRELEHVVHHALILSTSSTLRLSGFPSVVGGTPAKGRTLEEAERSHILSVMKECAWKLKGKEGAAECLGLNPSTLRFRMTKLGIKRPRLDS